MSCTPFYRDRMAIITPVNEHFLDLKAQPDLPVVILLKEPVIMREQGSGSQKNAEQFFERIGITRGDRPITVSGFGSSIFFSSASTSSR